MHNANLIEPIFVPPHLRDNEKRRKMLRKHLISLQKEADPELGNNLQFLEEALPDLLNDPPAWVGIGADGKIVCSESRMEVCNLLRTSQPPWLRLQL